jgi:hypothetical protein
VGKPFGSRGEGGSPPDGLATAMAVENRRWWRCPGVVAAGSLVGEGLGDGVELVDVEACPDGGRTRRSSTRCSAAGETAVLGRSGGRWSRPEGRRVVQRRGETRGGGG